MTQLDSKRDAGVSRERALALASALLAEDDVSRVELLPIAGRSDRYYVDADLAPSTYQLSKLTRIQELIGETGMALYIGGSIQVRSR